MNPTASVSSAAACSPAETQACRLHCVVSGLALTIFVLVLIALLLDLRLPGTPGWPEAALVVITAAATLVSLARRLPGQNVILAGAIIAGIGAAPAIFFGPFFYALDAGPRIAGAWAWPIPLIWIIAILNSRGVAQLILCTGRNPGNHGFRTIGITAALAVLFVAALDLFAAGVEHDWLPAPAGDSIRHGASLTNFPGWIVTALVILALATPTLIDKRQRRTDRPPDYHALAVWLLAMTLFSSGAFMRQLWSPAGFISGISVTIAVLAIRGARG